MVVRRFKSRKLKDFFFVNEAGNTRNGFYHLSTLIYRDRDITEYKAHYINRTWECYTFQTSMMGAVHQIKNELESRLLEEFKENNKIKRMTEKAKTIFESLLKKNETIQEYNLILKELRGY